MQLRIAQVLPWDSWGGDVGPSLLARGCGGRELALLSLAREWAGMGYEVDCFVPRDGGEEHEYGTGVHRYLPADLAPTELAARRYDAVISWEAPWLLGDPTVRDCQPLMLLGLQVAHLIGGIDEAVQFDAVVALSPWHRRFLLQCEPMLEPERVHVIPNGVDSMLIDGGDSLESRIGAARFAYTSSPDRGLVHMLEIWPKLRKTYPNATLDVFYGAKDMISRHVFSHYAQAEMALTIKDVLELPGVRDRGRVGRTELHKFLRSATALLYPCDSMAPTETGCCAVMEAMACGAPCVITNADCLGEEFGQHSLQLPLPLDSDEYVDCVLELLSDTELYEDAREAGLALVKERTWEKLASSWLDLFRELSPGSGRVSAVAAS